MARSDRKDDILSYLQDGPITSYSLASRLDAPEASIRRLIQRLRAEGHTIVSKGAGLYALVKATATTPVPSEQTALTGAGQTGA